MALLPALYALIVGELGAEAEACPGDLMPLLDAPLVVKRDWASSGCSICLSSFMAVSELAWDLAEMAV